MLHNRYDKYGFCFESIIDGQISQCSQWQDTDDCIYYLPLSMLADNGNATIGENEIKVPFECIYLLSDIDMKLLDVPPYYNKGMRLLSDGTLKEADFKYRIELVTSVPDGELIQFKRVGNVIESPSGRSLLHDAQYRLMEKVDEFNNTDAIMKDLAFNLRQFAVIKALAKECGCYLDSYLENENVYAPESIKLSVNKDIDGIKVLPSLPIEQNDSFQRSFERSRMLMPMYSVQNEEGERTRIIFDTEQRNQLEPLKQRKCRFNTKEEIRDFIEHPTQYFDPDLFDLSEIYSDRVIEIGIYKPKFYPFISPYRSTWIAGAEIETPENGTTKIEIETEEELAELEELIDEAEEKGMDVFPFADTMISVDDAKFLADMAHEQLSHPSKPINTKRNGREVLIIEENADELGFEQERPELQNEGRYTLYENDFLLPDFQLKPHQREGIAWLQHLYQHHAGGCLLADDMGLGKTLQVLYFIDWHSRNNPGHKPYLIVAPVSLMENWENEYTRFFCESRLKVSRMVSSMVPRQFNQKVIDVMQKMDILLTSYETLRNGQLNFCAVDYEIVVLDEAQKIKTPGTLVTNAAKALKSTFKVAMTGTPVENTLMDLWCIMDFCVPGLLGNAKSFAANYQTPLRNPDTDLEGIGNEIHNTLGLHFLRRVKSDVAKDLPSKFEVKESREMPAIQEQTYQHVINEYLSGIQENMLVTINQIREVSEHPYLYDDTLHDRDLPEVMESSARLQLTSVFLEQIRQKDEKVIIFSERKEIQRLLQRLVWERYNIVAKIVNGDTPTGGKTENRHSRQACIDDFQRRKGFNVIIMSPLAAGMGLNVTAANHVIHYSRHWNPAKEEQATDRAYRIGQTKDVYVYYPMAVSPHFQAFDVTLDELLARKSHLATSTIYPTEQAEVKVAEMGARLFASEPST